MVGLGGSKGGLKAKAKASLNKAGKKNVNSTSYTTTKKGPTAKAKK